MGGLFGGKTINSSAPIISSLRLQTSTEGRSIPLIFGRGRVSPNIIDYQDFVATPHTETQSAGKGGGTEYSNTSYTYSATLVMAVCESVYGTVNIETVWRDKDVFYSKIFAPAWAEAGLSLYRGSMLQQPFGYMQSMHPERALAYRGFAYVAASSYDLGTSAVVPNHSFEVVSGVFYSDTIPDASFAQIVSNLLTNPRFGAGFPQSKLGSLAAIDHYCAARNLFFSPVYTEQQPARDMINQLCEMCDIAPVWSDGVLTFRSLDVVQRAANGLTYTPNNTPLYDLDDTDYLDYPDLSRNMPSDAYNCIPVRFSSRANQYNETVIEAKDQAAIDIHGLRKSPEKNCEIIALPATAQVVANIYLQSSLRARNRYKVTGVAWRFGLLEPTDIITISDGWMGMDRVPVRIVEIEESDAGDLNLLVDELSIVDVDAATFEDDVSDKWQLNYNSSASPCLPPLIFEVESSQWRTNEEISLGIATAGEGSHWGGATVWISNDDLSYKNIGRVLAPAKYGVLTKALGQSASSSAEIALNNQSLTLRSVTMDAANQLASLSLVGDELVAYSSVNLLPNGSYAATLQKRGQYGTQAKTHLIGESFVRLDDAIFWVDVPFDKIGQTVYLKLTAFNEFGGGEQSLADVEPVAYVISGSPPGAPRSLTIDKQADGYLLQWQSPLDRDIDFYEVRAGSSWDGAEYLAGVYGLQYLAKTARLPPAFLVKSVDMAGNYSVAAAFMAVPAAVAPSIQSAPSYSFQTGNSPLLSWEDVVGDFDFYEVWVAIDGSNTPTILLATGKEASALIGLPDVLNAIYPPKYFVRTVDGMGIAGSFSPPVVGRIADYYPGGRTIDFPSPSAIWVVHHQLGRFPVATVVDTSGVTIIGGCYHNDVDTLTLTFGSAFAGKVHLR